MSHTFYDLQWQQSVDKLKHLSVIETVETPHEIAAQQENKNKEAITPKVIDLPREEAYDRFCLLYIRYLQIFRDIEESYDQIVHPQKRRDIKHILDLVMVRMLQIKRKAIQYSFYPGSRWNYISMDKYLSQLQLSLNGNKCDLDLIVPKYFLEEDLVEEDRLELLEEIFIEKKKYVKTPTSEDQNKCYLLHSSLRRTQLTLKQSMQIICKMERARQAIQRAKVLQKLKSDQPLKKLRDEKCKIMDQNTAAITIQRVYKGYSVRQQLQQRAINELLFLNMSLPNRVIPNNVAANQENKNKNQQYYDLSLPKFGTNVYSKQNQIREKRVNLRIENEVEYERSIPDIRDSVILEQGPKIREQARQQRFDWAIKQRELKGAYPMSFKLFYEEQEALKNGIDLNAPKPADDDAKTAKKGGKKGKDKKNKKESKKKPAKKGEKKGKKGKKGKGKKGEIDDGINEEDPNVHIQTPMIIKNEINGAIDKVYGEWRSLDETDNFAQKHCIDMVKKSVFPSVKKQIELEVDQQLLHALNNLKIQLGINTDSKPKKAKKSKKGKKGKKSKKKK